MKNGWTICGKMAIGNRKISAAEKELKRFIEEGQADFYRLAYSYVKHTEEAMDIVQEAAAKAFANIASLRNLEKMRSWFYRILVNECLTFLRRKKRFCIVDVNVLETIQKENAKSMDRSEENLDLYRAVLQLEPKMRTVVLLRFFQGMKLEEIAEITHTKLSTVKTRLYRALKELRLSLGEEVPE